MKNRDETDPPDPRAMEIKKKPNLGDFVPDNVPVTFTGDRGEIMEGPASNKSDEPDDSFDPMDMDFFKGDFPEGSDYNADNAGPGTGFQASWWIEDSPDDDGEDDDCEDDDGEDDDYYPDNAGPGTGWLVMRWVAVVMLCFCAVAVLTPRDASMNVTETSAVLSDTTQDEQIPQNPWGSQNYLVNPGWDEEDGYEYGIPLLHTYDELWDKVDQLELTVKNRDDLIAASDREVERLQAVETDRVAEISGLMVQLEARKSELSIFRAQEAPQMTRAESATPQAQEAEVEKELAEEESSEPIASLVTPAETERSRNEPSGTVADDREDRVLGSYAQRTRAKRDKRNRDRFSR